MIISTVEIWKDIPGFEGWYAVSSLGRIMRLRDGNLTRAGHILTPQKDACGYMRVGLSKNGVNPTCKVHRLVLSAFVGPRDNTWDANHKNFVRHDNRIDNLEWLEHKANVLYSAARGKYSKPGERNPKAKINRLIVEDIRSRRKLGQSYMVICDSLNLPKHIVADVSSGRSWA